MSAPDAAPPAVIGPPCPQCGFATTPGARFCRNCGAVLHPDALPVQPTPGPRFSAAALLAPVGRWANRGRARLRRTRRRTKVLLSVLVAAVVLAPGVYYVVMAEVVYTPDIPVQEMFAALQARDSVRLGQYVDGCRELCNPGALSRGYQPPTHVQILNTHYQPPKDSDPNQQPDDVESAVLVRYQLGGQTRQDVVMVAHRAAGWVRPWMVTRPAGKWVDVVSASLTNATIAGATIKTVKPRQQGEPARTEGAVFAPPGIYTVTAMSSVLWDSHPQQLVVTGTTAPTRTDVNVGLTLKPSVIDNVRQQVKDLVDTCAKSTSFDPRTPWDTGILDDCPFYGLEPTSPRNVHWTIIDYPQIELHVEDDGSVSLHTTAAGHARIDFEYTLWPTMPNPPWVADSQTVEYKVKGTIGEDKGQITWAQ